MTEGNSIGRAITITSAIAAISAVGYAIYFDYQRRNNSEFRKSLRTKAKKQKQEAIIEKEQAKQAKLASVLDFLKNELIKDPIPSDPTQMESIFATNVELGERLSMTPGNELQSASKFYKALAVYPNPADLLGIYQRTIPENIYENIVLMIAVLPPTNITSFISNAASETARQEEMDIIADIDDDEPNVEVERIIEEALEEEVEEEEEEADEEEEAEEAIKEEEDDAEANEAMKKNNANLADEVQKPEDEF